MEAQRRARHAFWNVPIVFGISLIDLTARTQRAWLNWWQSQLTTGRR